MASTKTVSRLTRGSAPRGSRRIATNRKMVKSIEPSKISPMPSGLLSLMKKNEILDLVAYILSAGDKDNPMFKK
ncbi:MAG: hypothetical protein ACI9VS_003281 [Candidatus Binatia bacterium]|jgi:hypothetical protein